jgi:hypothetical protein
MSFVHHVTWYTLVLNYIRISLVDHVTWYTLVLNYIRMPCPL